MKDSSSYVYVKFEPEHMAKPYVKKLGSVCPEGSYDELLKVFMRLRNTFVENLELRVESMQFFSEWPRIRAAIGPCRTRSVDLSRCKSPLMVDFAGKELGAKSFHFSVHRDLPLELDAMLLKEPVKQADELVLSVSSHHVGQEKRIFFVLVPTLLVSNLVRAACIRLQLG